MLKKFITKEYPLLAALSGAVVLSIESYLSLNNKSLCKTEACDIVSQYLTISEPLLISFGTIFFWLLSLVFYFSARYPSKLKYVPYLLLAPALAFDGCLIGFQIFSIEQKCMLCISVAALLFVVTILYCLKQKTYFLIVLFSLVWLASFSVNKFLTLPPPQSAYSKMTFFSVEGMQNEDKEIKQRLTLIISLNCQHCSEVVHFLSENYAGEVNIRLATIDTDPKSLAKLSLFLEKVIAADNPFQLLGEIKESSHGADTPIRKGLKLHAQSSLNFLNNLGITEIPILLTEVEKDEKRILIGSSQIISFLKENTIR